MEQSLDWDLGMLKEISLLYVEDDDNVRESLLRFLRRRFDVIYAARNGREGLDLYRAHSPQMVVTDIQMPVMDGLEMAHQIREESPETPILVTTAFNEIPYLMQAIKIGITEYIKKPIIRDDFVNSLKKSAQILLQKREIERKNRIIHTIIDWQPCFSILTDGNNLDYVNRGLLNFLGYETMEEFVKHHESLDNFIVATEGMSPKEREKDTWYEWITRNPDDDHVVYLKNGRSEDEARAYVVRFHQFSESNQYLFAFLRPDQVIRKKTEGEEKTGQGSSLCEGEKEGENNIPFNE